MKTNLEILEYKKKLEGFNDTEKYKSEMDFMKKLMDIQPIEKVLDYGCGIGTMIEYLKRKTEGDVYGYDVYDFFEGNPQPYIRNSYHFTFNKIYFMHSLAHIPNINYCLERLKDFCEKGTQIFVLTPNKMWLELQNPEGYKPDKTVVGHFSSDILIKVFADNGFKVLMKGQIGKELKGQHERLWIAASL